MSPENYELALRFACRLLRSGGTRFCGVTGEPVKTRDDAIDAFVSHVVSVHTFDEVVRQAVVSQENIHEISWHPAAEAQWVRVRRGDDGD